MRAFWRGRGREAGRFIPGGTQTAPGGAKEICHIEGAWGCDRALGNDGLMALRYSAATTVQVGAVSGVDGRTQPRLLALDKTIVFHFYNSALVISAVSSRCRLYSVSLSQRKLIPNSALFILPFREFYA